MTSGRTGCGAYPNARCFTYSLKLKPHFLASTAILLFSWSVTRNAIRFSFFINQLLVSSLFGGLGNAPKISPVSGLEGELAAHKFPACYTTGQPQHSVDRYVCFLPLVQRSVHILCQLSYLQGPDNPSPGMYRKGFLPPMRILLSDGGFGKKCHRVSTFAAANRQMRWHVVLRHSHIDGISPKNAVILSFHAVESIQKRQRLLGILLRWLGRLRNRLKMNRISQPFQFLPKH